MPKTKCMYCHHTIDSNDEEANMHLSPNTCILLLNADTKELRAMVEKCRLALVQSGRILSDQSRTRKEALEVLKQAYKRTSGYDKEM